ncbi:MAG TPA: pyrroloquinoline quinone biosynthesis peptide chaperone PqqD [Polyangia bacterium]|jgi:coenzyme PQQ biosynthesis protein PqqD|nr:pyrroloquinoline quinone biosynthesis peptide chaperone PqqD [Polyangia bacterium]
MIDRTTRLSLARQVRLKLDPRSGKQVLLYPEKGLALNDTAARVAALCGEPRTVGEIVARLVAAADGAVPAARIEQEVLAFLRALEDRGLLVVHAP